MEAIEPEYYAKMNALAGALNEIFNGDGPKTTGFVLLAFKFGDEGRMNYISNAERDCMVKAMREFICRATGAVGEEEQLQ